MEERLTLNELVTSLSRVFLDTPPIIYYVEGTERYKTVTAYFFDAIQAGHLEAVTSPITLAECLVLPLRQGNVQLAHQFVQAILMGTNTQYVPIGVDEALLAAEFRVRYNLALTDAFQVAVAVAAGCDAFLTNDKGLKRIREVSVRVLDDLCESEADDS
ncbi:MAG: PIN domain-containing protein [Fimbriimonadales bacterium]|nr:PIN domain-containing protein [Fimbriimonadales bacterium]